MKLEEICDEAKELLADYCNFQIGVEPSGLEMLPESEDLRLIAFNAHKK